MGVIRWEDFYDGKPWTWGYLGSEPVCTIEVARVGNLECQTLEIGSGFPGKRAADFQGIKIPAFGDGDAKNIAEQLLQDWMDDVGLVPKPKQRTEVDLGNADIIANGYATIRNGGAA